MHGTVQQGNGMPASRSLSMHGGTPAHLPLETMECKGAAKTPPAAQEGISAPADNTSHKANHTHPWPGSSKVLPDLQV